MVYLNAASLPQMRNLHECSFMTTLHQTLIRISTSPNYSTLTPQPLLSIIINIIIITSLPHTTSTRLLTMQHNATPPFTSSCHHDPLLTQQHNTTPHRSKPHNATTYFTGSWQTEADTACQTNSSSGKQRRCVEREGKKKIVLWPSVARILGKEIQAPSTPRRQAVYTSLLFLWY